MRAYGRYRGSPVEMLMLGSNDGLRAEILTLGGTLASLTLPVEGRPVPLILSLPDLNAYLQDGNYMGQIIGRYANRIANAEFELDGRLCRLTPNDGRHALHGGSAPFGREIWRVAAANEGENGSVRLAHVSPNGAGGFPGELEVAASMSITADTLRLDFEAKTDAPTPISFSWHPYFNLSGRAAAPISGHGLRVAATSYLPVDSTWIPTGEIAPIAGSHLDYRAFREIGARAPDEDLSFLNHCFALDERGGVAAEVYCRETDIRMEVRTDLPGLQVYDGYYLRDQHPDWHALAIEPGNFPDAPNRPSFPDCILRPGEVHRSFMSYTFRTGAG